MGESIDFTYNQALLIRWLLKISYNGARAHNADVEILNKFIPQISGKEELSGHVLGFLHLISPTRIGGKETVGAASRNDIKNHEIEKPDWFRTTQLRMSYDPLVSVVQRQVIINSFAFTLFAVSPDSKLPNTQLESLSQEFLQLFPDAQFLNSAGKVPVKAGDYHAVQSIAPLFLHYPNRFQETDNTTVKQLYTGDISIVVILIELESIEKQDVSTTASIFAAMMANKESAVAYSQRVEIMIDGFDEDPRELWEIQEVRHYLRCLLTACPYIMFLAFPEGSMLQVFLAAWVYESELDKNTQEKRIERFLEITFSSLNQVIHRLALSVELNEKISNDAIRSLFTSTRKDV